MFRGVRIPSLCLLLASWGCGDDGAPADGGDASTGSDAGVDAGSAIAPPMAVIDPVPAAPPDFSACPAGWRAVTDEDGIAFCDPWPATGHATCPPGEAHFPGEPGCATVGRPCPSGDFPDAPDGVRVIYVQPDATGGDGTRAQPFATVAQAIAAATAGTVIQLSRGTWDEDVVLGAGVTLRGACAAETTILSTRAGTPVSPGVVRSVGAGARLEDLRIGPSARPGVWLSGSAAELAIEGVVIERVTRAAISAFQGARMTAREVAVRDTQSSPEGWLGRAITIETGARAECRRASLEGNRETAVFAYDGSSVTLEDVAMLDTAAQLDGGLFGYGLSLLDGAQATVRRAVIARAHSAGIRVSGARSSIDAEHVVVEDVESAALDGYEGFGVTLDGGASGTIRHLRADRTRSAGIYVLGPETTVTFEDALVRDVTSRRFDDRLGHGMEVEEGGHVTLRRASFLRARGAGILLVRGDTLVAEDLVVSDIAPEEATSEYGRGIGIQFSEATIARARVERAHESGVFVQGAVARIDDLVVSDTLPRAVDDIFGRGMNVQEGSTVTLRRAVLERNRESGVFLDGDDPSLGLPASSLAAEDLVIRGTLPQASDGQFGRGLSVQLEATATVTRALLEDNHDVALIANGAGGRLTVTDLVARGTLPNGEGRFGRGVNVQAAATASVTRARIEANHDTGAFAIGEGTALTMADVEVRGTLPDGAGLFGRGISVEQGARVEVSRALVSDNVDIGVAGFGAGAEATLTEIDVRGTRAHAGFGGTGIGAFLEARISVRDFVIAGSELCGVMVARDAMLDLSTGTVRGNLIGACVQVDGYDIARLSDEVVYTENETQLDSSSLPVPDVGGGLADTPDT